MFGVGALGVKGFELDMGEDWGDSMFYSDFFNLQTTHPHISPAPPFPKLTGLES